MYYYPLENNKGSKLTKMKKTPDILRCVQVYIVYHKVLRFLVNIG